MEIWRFEKRIALSEKKPPLGPPDYSLKIFFIIGELTVIEYFGWILWLSSIAFEHTADLQKKKFVRDCIKNKIKNAVCDVGLWRYRYLIFILFKCTY